MRAILSIFIFILFGTHVGAQNKDAGAWAYFGLTSGSYRYAQAPMSYRAWEFNNFVGVKEKMNANRSFSGYDLGLAFNLMVSDKKTFGFLMAAEYAHKGNKMSGSRDSLGVLVEQAYNQTVNCFHIGIGVSLNNVGKFNFGYIPFSGLSRIKIKETESVGGVPVDREPFYKGTVILVKNMFYIQYRVNKRFAVSLNPYLESHVFDGAAEFTYNNSRTRIIVAELYNLKNYGASICLNYVF